MEILHVRSERSDIDLGFSKKINGNRITLLTGPNGCGKTEILTVLASAFREKKLLPKEHYVCWRRAEKIFDTYARHDGAQEYPERIIAQTFSPFSRFPATLKEKTTLTDVYSLGRSNENRYVTIGLHRSSRFWGANLGRQTLKEAIYRLSESVGQVGVISKVLLKLGYLDEINFHFKLLPQLIKIKIKEKDDRLSAAVELLEDAVNNARSLKFKAPLVSELRRHGIYGVAELILEAVEIISEFEKSDSSYQYNVKFTSERRIKDFSIIQSFALLERLNLLRLESCLLTRTNGGTMDVANASSGQQQMLCSIIGLATAIRDDSLVLIDEPELSLHPQWQQLFLEYLQAVLLPFRDCHIFVATHSPLIVQGARTLGIDVVALGNRELAEPKGPADNSVEETLMDVFETPVPFSSHLANKVFSIVSLVEEEALEKPNSKTQKMEAEAELKALQRLYSSAMVRDDKSLALLNDALELVQMDPYSNEVKSDTSNDE
ncbi:AAA family ATPase [Janthinobacterium sp. PLB04]|uniref:AAA family ATPase n=1 Tax=Janthinobacterium lividum TaxID=29581 RepID=A0AAJ4MPB7_9BURK|nr:MULTISPECIES: AAA family ATPase [Janthinobacterium]QSX94603.1 AAA family ATPase [Janthinobacterium lividum]UGQ34414.1 AAA family ATPase [Janthinobacterium sp. PLB04]